MRFDYSNIIFVYDIIPALSFIAGVMPLSVIKSKRDESEMEFLYNARLLQIHTIKKCVGFPKRYTFYVSIPIARLAIQIHGHVKRANSIYPVNQHEVQMRRDHMIEANAMLQDLISQIEIANELFGIEGDAMRHWLDIVEKEIRLVKGAMKKDRERYKDLPDNTETNINVRFMKAVITELREIKDAIKGNNAA